MGHLDLCNISCASEAYDCCAQRQAEACKSVRTAPPAQRQVGASSSPSQTGRHVQESCVLCGCPKLCRCVFLKDNYEMGATKAALNKIKCLRSYFRRVRNEYLSKKKSGSGAADVRKPNWFLYEPLLFILDGEIRPRTETFTLVHAAQRMHYLASSMRRCMSTRTGTMRLRRPRRSKTPIIRPVRSPLNTAITRIVYRPGV
ncbi:hypothetical protein PR048_023357 [Dryococelus australis]|uniref:Uncharacterized protein n=1 Tax=Dryococelus australis TaxID=614101 RepID=A0ABQ9GTU7_9NEOP|nr:hypothetical protein PR048_023357 [Dryococelus australis]